MCGFNITEGHIGVTTKVAMILSYSVLKSQCFIV